MRTCWSLIAAGIVALGLELGCSGDIGDPAADGDPDAGNGDPDSGVTSDAGDPDAAPRIAACSVADGDEQFSDPATGHCYFWVNSALMRDQARASCQAMNAHLVTITDAAENAAVANVAPDALPDPNLASSIDSWTGLNDLATEMTHVWDTGEPFNFDAWRTGEPNNNNANDPNGEDCVVFEGDTNQWDDRSCTLTPLRYICERDP